jgi:RNA polymerase sigma factor (sigma-70 family)
MSPTLPTRPLRAQSDARLVELSRRGQAAAFEALVRRYRRSLLGYCRHLSAGDAQAEDALQQGLMQAWRALCRGDEVSDVKSWLYRVVHNAALDALRRPGQDNIELDELRHGRSIRSAGGELEQRLAMRRTLAELAALPPLQREALVRTAVHGDSHAQVASALGLSHAAVRGLVHRARVTLRTAATTLVPSRLPQWAVRSGLAAPAGGDGGITAGGSAGLLATVAKAGAVLATGGVLATGFSATGRERPHRARAAAATPVAAVSSAPAAMPERLAVIGRYLQRGSPVAGTSAPAGNAVRPVRALMPLDRRRSPLRSSGLVAKSPTAGPGPTASGGSSPQTTPVAWETDAPTETDGGSRQGGQPGDTHAKTFEDRGGRGAEGDAGGRRSGRGRLGGSGTGAPTVDDEDGGPGSGQGPRGANAVSGDAASVEAGSTDSTGSGGAPAGAVEGASPGDGSRGGGGGSGGGDARGESGSGSSDGGPSSRAEDRDDTGRGSDVSAAGSAGAQSGSSGTSGSSGHSGSKGESGG